MKVRSFFFVSACATIATAAVAPVLAQSAGSVLARGYGRSTVEVDTSRAQPGGVLGIRVRNARWTSANTLLDGRRGALAKETGQLFGLVPLALDTTPAEHKLSLFFPGGRRGGATSLQVPVAAIARSPRPRTLTPEALALASGQAALGHGRFLLNAIRTRDLPASQTGPLRPPVDAPIAFPFGGAEDFGMVMGPLKDGLMGEHHRGVDYDIPPGTAVRSPGAGVVVLARSLIFSGETVVIGHGKGLVSVLSHLSNVTVHEGETVSAATIVGASGRTGVGALTPHLCFSVYLHSINVDPEAVMDATLWGR